MPVEPGNLDLLKPLDLTSSEAEKIFRLREQNSGPKANEEIWLTRARNQHESISEVETTFFAELDRRMSN